MPDFDPLDCMGYHRNCTRYSSRFCWHHKAYDNDGIDGTACYRWYQPKSVQLPGNEDRLMSLAFVDSSLGFDFLGEIFQNDEMGVQIAKPDLE